MVYIVLVVNIRSVENKAYEKYTSAKWLCFDMTRGSTDTLPIIDEKTSVFPSMNARKEKAICERQLSELHCQYVQCMNRVLALGKLRKARDERIKLLQEFVKSAEVTVARWIERYQLLTYEALSIAPRNKNYRRGEENDGWGYSQAL